jgi:diguanylate cyclase (GGDEF)-like protein/PAS domain S-box-containing protein
MTPLKNENLYSKIFDSAIVAIGVTDAEGRYVIVNPHWCTLLGYSAEEAKDMFIKDVTPQEDWDTSIISFEYLISQKGRQMRKQRRYQRRDGSIFWADLYASSLFDENDNPVGILGVFVDIDKQVIAEQIQRELYQNMEALNHELSLANDDLKRLARHDALTSLYNRRVMEEILTKESSRSMRTKRGFGVAIADIDNFKKINDTYGHDCGDRVLQTLSELFLSGIRITDNVGRWGGEEFLFVFTETSCEGAMIVIERIRQSVQRAEILCGDTHIKVTITIGLSFHEGDEKGKDMLSEADVALYKGKKSGKNKVVCFQDNCTDTM